MYKYGHFLAFTIIYWIPYFWNIQVPEYVYDLLPIKNLLSCKNPIEWSVSIIFAYFIMLGYTIVNPFFFLKYEDIEKIRPTFGGFVSSIFLSMFVVLLFVIGIPIGSVDGTAIFLSSMYCASAFGPFVILYLLSVAAAAIVMLFLICVKKMIFNHGDILK
jgi:hypothetical protein